jgi:hypothetical protein
MNVQVERVDEALLAHRMRVTRILFARELLRDAERRLIASPPTEIFRRVSQFEQASSRYLKAIES